MKAAVRLNYGSTNAITVRSWPKPIPNSKEVLIKVHATTVNRTDCGVLNGAPYIFRFFVGWPNPRFPVLGTDFAGVVEGVGADVENFQVGDRVWGFDDHGLPTQAEFFVYRADKNILTIPNGITFVQAAASAEAAHYAVNFIKYATIPAQASVLVNGGTGGIGSALIQLLSVRGVNITATSGTQNLERVKALGADRVIDYEKESFLEIEEEFDVVFDAVGKSTFNKCKKLLKPKGEYLSSELGEGIENVYLPFITRAKGGKRVIFPIPNNIKESMDQIQELLSTGKFSPLIDKAFPLEDIVLAYKYVCSGQKIGNVILAVT